MPIKNRLGWTTFITGTVCGVSLGAFITFFLLSWWKADWQLTWKNEIGFGDLFNFLSNIFITVVIAFLLTQYIQKFIADKRSEKDILIGIVEEAAQSLDFLHNKFVDCCNNKKLTNDDQQIIKNKQKELSNRLHSAQSALVKCAYDFSVIEVQKDHTKYKDIITGNNFAKKLYIASDKEEAETLYLKMKQNLQNLIIDINKV
jgi:hypothetical protein